MAVSKSVKVSSNEKRSLIAATCSHRQRSGQIGVLCALAFCIVGIIVRHLISVILIAALGVLLSLLVKATQLEFHTSRMDLISAGEHYKQRDQMYEREFENLPERIIAVIRAAHPEKAKAFATVLGQRWKRDPTIEKVLYRIDVEALHNKALLYPSPEELMALLQRLHHHQSASEHAHAILTSGGASVGAYDLVRGIVTNTEHGWEVTTTGP
jgi:hypothetical protein